MKKTFVEFIVAILLMFIASAVTAWGYQVFWNKVILNVWQLFTTTDIINTFKLPYGACLAIAFGIVMVYSKKKESSENLSDGINKAIIRIITKLILIALTILVTALVF